MLADADTATDAFLTVMYMNCVFVLYIFKNLCESFYAMWKRKKMDYVTPAILTNLCGLLITIIWVYRYKTSWSNIDPSTLRDEELVNVEMFKLINDDETVSLYILMALLLGI